MPFTILSPILVCVNFTQEIAIYFCLLYHFICNIEYYIHPANWRSRSATVCFTCNRNIVFEHKIILQWRHNGHDSVSNHQPSDCSLNRLFRRRSKKTSKLRVTGLCAGNSPGTGEFPAQMASNAQNVSIWWRHHELLCWRCEHGVFSMSLAVIYLCIIWVHIGFVCVYFGFTLFSNRAHGELKMVSNQHIVNTKILNTH